MAPAPSAGVLISNLHLPLPAYHLLLMTQLPPPLAPWASLLDLFPHELAVALGPWVQRLDRAIGPMRVPHGAGQGEPDGYDGLTRRGLYERLLVSEWLLAE